MTLLALGNGAPDLSASIAAVKSGHVDFALGALLGSGMFVGCVVAGTVILVSGGAKARGALLRDAGAFLVAVFAVTAVLVHGRASYAQAAALLTLYVVFVLVVLGADLWHIWQRRRGAQRPQAEVEQPLLASPAPTSATLSGPRRFTEPPVAELFMEQVPTVAGHTGLGTVELAATQSAPAAAHGFGPRGATLPRGQYPSGRSQGRQEEPLALRSTWHAGAPLPLPARQFHAQALTEIAGGALHISSPAEDEEMGSGGSNTSEASPHSVLHTKATSQPVSAFSSADVQEEGCPNIAASTISNALPAPRPSSGMSGMASVAVSVGDSLNAALDVMECPLVWLRRLSIPLLDPQAYSRPVFLTALVMAPLFAAAYFGPRWRGFVAAAVIGVASGTAGALASKTQDPAKPPVWGCGTQIPLGAALVSLYAFAIAAMWIDLIASEVVGLLEYFGVLSGVSHAVLGLTVLAWANCIGDLSTNVAMARASLSNMAMTACYAGPLFNLLVGLGLGFIRALLAKSQPVQLVFSGTSVLGILFLCLMCSSVFAVGLLNGGFLPARFGWMLLSLYSLYLFCNLVLAVH